MKIFKKHVYLLHIFLIINNLFFSTFSLNSKNQNNKKEHIYIKNLISFKKNFLNQNLNDEILIAAKKFIDEISNKIKDDQQIIYYKGLTYSFLSKRSLAIDSDGLEYLKIALQSFNRIIKNKNPNKELKSFSQSHIKELYERYLFRQKQYLDKNSSERVEDLYKICKIISPNRPDTHIVLANDLLEKRKYYQAENQYKKYYELGGRNPKYFSGIASILIGVKNEIYKAKNIIDIGLQLYPFNNEIIMIKFLICKNENTFDNFPQDIQKIKYKKPGAKEYLLSKYYQKIENKKKYFRYLKISAFKAQKNYEPQLELGAEFYNRAIKKINQLKELINNEKLDDKKPKNITNSRKKKQIRQKKQNKKSKLEKNIKRNMQNARFYLRRAYYIFPENKLILNTINKINTYLLMYKNKKQAIEESLKQKEKEKNKNKDTTNLLNSDQNQSTKENIY